eukprot:GHVT01039438.1.p1 GENE.GHVT01039438.1~~GHVT01039438.1.p1  ORF type:complete len:317 (+),score=70.34 GHVT01039438.1:221-1171(+)
MESSTPPTAGCGSLAKNNAKEYMHGHEVFYLPDGRIYHLGLLKGELANKIVTVGCHKRVDTMAAFLDADSITTRFTSSRLFKTVTGSYKGVSLSIVGIGMGPSNMDMFVREAAEICAGPMAIIRLGTCGILRPGAAPGSLIVAGKGSRLCHFNHAKFGGAEEKFGAAAAKDVSHYVLTKPIMPDKALNDLLLASSLEFVKHSPGVFEGLVVTGDSFYNSQGRNSSVFDDRCEDVLPEFQRVGVDSIEMECQTLFHLAAISRRKIFAAASLVGIAHRTDRTLPNISTELSEEVMKEASKACLEALAGYELPAAGKLL